MLDIMERYVQIVTESEAPVVFELGANDGYHTKMLKGVLDKGKKQHTYYAFEPDPRQVEVFNKRNPGVPLIKKAVGVIDGPVEFLLSGCSTPGKYFSGSSSLREPDFATRVWKDMTFTKQIVEGCRLDTFCKERGVTKIDFIWADIQGCEEDMIRGGVEILKRTRYLYTEYHKDMYKGSLDLQGIANLLPGWEVVQDYKGDALLENKKMG